MPLTATASLEIGKRYVACFRGGANPASHIDQEMQVHRDRCPGLSSGVAGLGERLPNRSLGFLSPKDAYRPVSWRNFARERNCASLSGMGAGPKSLGWDLGSASASPLSARSRHFW